MAEAADVQVGDVIEVGTPRGLMYVQLSGKTHGGVGSWFVRVLEGFYEESLSADRRAALVASPSLYTLNVWWLGDVGRLVANEPVPAAEAGGVPRRAKRQRTPENPLGWDAVMLDEEDTMHGHEFIERYPDVDWSRLPCHTSGHANQTLELIGRGGDPFAEQPKEISEESRLTPWLDGPTLCCRFDGSLDQAWECYTDLSKRGFEAMIATVEHLPEEPAQWWVLAVTNGTADDEAAVNDAAAHHGGRIAGRDASEVRRVLDLGKRSEAEHMRLMDEGH